MEVVALRDIAEGEEVSAGSSSRRRVEKGTDDMNGSDRNSIHRRNATVSSSTERPREVLLRMSMWTLYTGQVGSWCGSEVVREA